MGQPGKAFEGAALFDAAVRPQTSYELLNAFVDGGWFGKLTGLQATVWIIHLRHRNGATGRTCVGPTFIANRIGHKKINHVCEARSALVKLGLLTMRNGEYEVNVPTLTSPESGLVQYRDCAQNGTGDSPETGQNVVPKRDNKQLNTTRDLNKGAGLPASAGDELPESLRVPEFESAWALWEQHRREIRHKLTPTTRQKQLAQCAKWGPARAAAAIEHSITKGWQGIYEEEGVKNYGSARRLQHSEGLSLPVSN